MSTALQQLNFPILLAEDDPVSRKLLEKTLQKAGYEVVSAENGRRALALFDQRYFPIVLSDWMMPEMDGLALCKALRQKESEGYVFIILLTAKDSKDDIVQGLEAGADDYLTKPFIHAELFARLNTGRRILEQEIKLRAANEEIQVLSRTDPLTGCFNRGYLMERLPEEIMRARRYRHPLSLVLCDIDHFKKVNDTYGHQFGDEVLKKFVMCIQSSIREGADWLARYGGEEFLIVLPETGIKGARAMAERLREAIQTLDVPVAGSKVSITASFGVAGFDPDTPSGCAEANLMINKADKLLYQAKQGGRNRVAAIASAIAA